MDIGLKYGRNTWRKVETCQELTGLNLKTAEDTKIYVQKVHDYTCRERVKFAVRKTIEILLSR